MSLQLKRKGRRRKFSGGWGEWESRTEHMLERLVRRDPLVPPGLLACWRNRIFAVQFTKDGETCRLTVHRLDGTDGISWAELQRIHLELAPDTWCVELFPPKKDVVHDHNMRHLWVIGEPSFGWKADA